MAITNYERVGKALELLPEHLPSMRGESISIRFGCDVSGSISDEEIHEALSEVKGIADQFSDYCI